MIGGNEKIYVCQDCSSKYKVPLRRCPKCKSMNVLPMVQVIKK